MKIKMPAPGSNHAGEWGDNEGAADCLSRIIFERDKAL
jgi:hypothetical protein